MKKVILLLWFMPYMAFSQISENFESGSLSAFTESVPGRWSADTTGAISGKYSLHHIFDSQETGSDQVARSLLNLNPELDTVLWQFSLKYANDPSSSNNWSVFILSDKPPPDMKPGAAVNAYAIGVNLTGSDDTLRFYKISNGAVSVVKSLKINWQVLPGTIYQAFFNITRIPAGEWRFTIKIPGTGFESATTCFDDEFTSANWFGLLYRYTSTRDRLIWMDDILIDGTFYTDTTALKPPEKGDVIITEIMADPTPAVALPQEEYIELLNRSGRIIDISGWSLLSGETKITLPKRKLEKEGRYILCSSSDTSLFSGFGNVIGTVSFPALNDDGKNLVLLDKEGNMIHCVSYEQGWYRDQLKAVGGWSLEMIDAHFPFYAEGNWKASCSPKGGTPGAENSVATDNPDIVFDGIRNVFPTDSIHILLELSEPVPETGNFKTLLSVEGKVLSAVDQLDLAATRFLISLVSQLKKGEKYVFQLSERLTDFGGNSPLRSSFHFGLPEPVQKGDVVFNELLFNPLPGDADYIEMVNKSDHPVDMSKIFLSSANNETVQPGDRFSISDEARLMMPADIIAITSGRLSTITRYPSAVATNIFEITALPSMNDDKGHLFLFDYKLMLCDEVYYSSEMHFPLLASVEGVSLERISPVGNSSDKKNWHSASETSGWGTPGAVNSVYRELPPGDNRVKLSSKRISPDNDGYEDVLTISFTPEEEGSVISVTIFDEYGALARKLCNNVLAGSESLISWDGTDDSGSLLPAGIYIILVNLYTAKGKTDHWKMACTLAR